MLTTFNRTLAESLKDQLQMLEPKIVLATDLGETGVYVAGVDQIVNQVVTRAGDLGGRDGNPGSVAAVLGPRTAEIRRTRPGRWQAADQARRG